jgi:hypothetical protein
MGVVSRRVASRSRGFLWDVTWNVPPEGWIGSSLLTWKLAPLDGDTVGGEVLGEKLRLCGLARPIEALDDDESTTSHVFSKS